MTDIEAEAKAVVAEHVKDENARGRRRAGAFALFGVIVFAVLSLQGYYINQVRTLSKQSHALAQQAKVSAAQAKQQAKLGAEAKIGECSYKADLAGRVKQSKHEWLRTKAFAKRNPNGALGFSAAAIKQAVVQQHTLYTNLRSALESLRPVHCPKPKPKPSLPQPDPAPTP